MRHQHLSHPLILLIDDSVADQRLLVELLTGHRFRLAIAQSGMDGYRKALLNKPDLILLDLHMPGIDGFGVCRMLKANPETHDIPVLFLTANNEPEQRLEGLLLGAVDYIPKPFSTDLEVLARVKLHLAHARQTARPAAAPAESALPPAPVAPPASPSPQAPVFPSASTSQLNSQVSVLVKVAVDYLTHDLANAPSPARLARLVGTNETTLNEAFRRELNQPIHAYLREVRLLRARALLLESDVPIRLIGEHVGYQHSGNFTTAFRQRFGVTPREVRKRQDELQRPDASGDEGALLHAPDPIVHTFPDRMNNE